MSSWPTCSRGERCSTNFVLLICVWKTNLLSTLRLKCILYAVYLASQLLFWTVFLVFPHLYISNAKGITEIPWRNLFLTVPKPREVIVLLLLMSLAYLISRRNTIWWARGKLVFVTTTWVLFQDAFKMIKFGEDMQFSLPEWKTVTMLRTVFMNLLGWEFLMYYHKNLLLKVANTVCIFFPNDSCELQNIFTWEV